MAGDLHLQRARLLVHHAPEIFFARFIFSGLRS
jgi:hypothetical protein